MSGRKDRKPGRERGADLGGHMYREEKALSREGRGKRGKGEYEQRREGLWNGTVGTDRQPCMNERHRKKLEFSLKLWLSGAALGGQGEMRLWEGL